MAVSFVSWQETVLGWTNQSWCRTQFTKEIATVLTDVAREKLIRRRTIRAVEDDLIATNAIKNDAQKKAVRLAPPCCCWVFILVRRCGFYFGWVGSS